MKYTIGIDIGGTNTDAVLIDEEKRIVALAKVGTTEDIALGFEQVVRKLLARKVGVEIESIIVGTTHATNAILQRKELYRVGVIRIAGQRPQSPPPCYGWPKELAEVILCGYATVDGGFECHGGAIRKLNENQLRDSAQELIRAGAESLAIIGVFSPMNAEHELAAVRIIREISQIPITLSHQIGGVGYIERENSSILNSALKKVMETGFAKLEQICQKLGLDCPLLITQNNGSRISLEEATAHPILTISAGPTNSFVGASKLSGLLDAIIVDIGGTSTDIGLIKGGSFRRSLNISSIGGVKLNFPMPDVVSLAIGGGSLIETSPIKVGPRSVGREVTTRAQCFGGRELTLTDLAVAAGHLQIPNAQEVRIESQSAMEILRQVIGTIEEHIGLLDSGNLPIILVGGGAAVFPRSLLSDRYLVPENAQVANALGAALSRIAGSVDTIVSLTDQEKALSQLRHEAIAVAIAKGALPESVVVSDVQIIPYHYVPNNIARVILTAHGIR
ncbi:MAG: hydantoinase/oxoprolinase family protein [Verrucomicrobia bacterium]|nr:hydantoinase/oxoprolinase family protein [Verrucomicrobiota bacterium]